MNFMMKFLTTNIWDRITQSVSEKKQNLVAVAYFGTGGAELMPLKKGDVLVVDASDAKVQSGSTNPAELRKLLDKGVKIFSHPNLHSKVYLLGNKLFIGSANVSINSKENLFEAVFKTSDPDAIKEAKKYILGLANFLIEKEELSRLEGIHGSVKLTNNKGKVQDGDFIPKIYFMKIERRDFSPGHEPILKRGRKIANQTSLNGNGLEEYEWIGVPKFIVGDVILDFYAEDNLLEPPKRIVHLEFWEGTDKCFIFCKSSEKKEKKFSPAIEKIFGANPRQGFLSKEKSKKIMDYWKLTYNQL